MPVLPLPLSAKYLETRRGQQRTVNMYRHTDRGYRQRPSLNGFARVSTTQDNNVSANVNGAQSFWVGDSGTKLYTVQTNDVITQYTLSPANDISSASAAGLTVLITSAGLTVNNVRILGFKSDGTELLVGFVDSATGNGYVSQWTLSSAWDISTATETDTTAFATPMAEGTTATLAGFLNSTGTYVYVTGAIVGQSAGLVRRFPLSVAYDPSSKGAVDTMSLETAMTKAGDIATSSDLLTIYCTDNTGVIYTYELGTAGDLSTYDGTVGTYSPTNPGTTTVGLAVFNSNTDIVLGEADSPDVVWKIDITAGGSKSGRGAINMAGVIYSVIGDTLYSISSAGVTTDIGAIAGTERVVMETDGNQLVITTGSDGGTIYVYTVATGLVTVTDVDVTDTAKSSAYLDLRFWFDQPDGEFVSSKIDDATSFDALDFGEAESFNDDIDRVYAHNEMLYFFGATSTEVWRTGVGRPPADRQSVIERGIIGTYAVDSVDDVIYFVDQYRRPNILSGLEYQSIYPPAIAERWASYTTVSDCIVMAYTYRQNTFVEFVFPSENESWIYHAQSGEWSETESSIGGITRSVAYVEAFGNLHVLDKDLGYIYRLSETSYTDLSDTFGRVVRTGLVSAETMGMASREISVDGLWLTFDSTGSGDVSVSFAKNGSAFGTAKTITIASGTNTYPLAVPWGRCREGVFQITTSANAGIDFIDASVQVAPIAI